MIHIKHQALFFTQKIRKFIQHVSFDVVVIGALMFHTVVHLSEHRFL